MSNWWDNAPAVELETLKNKPAESGGEWWKSAPEVSPRRVEQLSAVAKHLSRTPALGLGEHVAAAKIPAEDRELFGAIAAKQYAEDHSTKPLGYGTRLATSLVQGMIDTGLPIAKRVPKSIARMVGGGDGIPELDPDQERYKQRLLAIRQANDPTISPDTNAPARWLQQAAQMSYPMVNSVTAGKLAGGGAELAGLGNVAAKIPLIGKVTGVDVATAAGSSGSFLPQTADQTYTSLIGEGVDPKTAWRITAVSAPIEAALESIIPDPLSPKRGMAKGMFRQVLGSFVKQATVNYTKELTEEGLQKVVNESAMEVGRRLDPNIPDKPLSNILKSGVQEMLDSAGPMAIMMGPGTAIGGVQTAKASAARPARLAQLKELRASKPFISAEDAQTHQIPGETRKERLANADSEIKQLEQEIKNAEVPPEAAPPQEVRQAEPVQGQVPAVEAVPQEPPAQPKVPVDEDLMKSILEMQNAEKAPEATPAPVQPKPQEEVLAKGLNEVTVGKPASAPVPAEPTKKNMGKKPPESSETVASVPVMITKKMEQDLRGRGFSQKAIDSMTPQQAWEKLGGMPTKPPESLPAAPQQASAPEVASEPTKPVPAPPAASQEAVQPVKGETWYTKDGGKPVVINVAGPGGVTYTAPNRQYGGATDLEAFLKNHTQEKPVKNRGLKQKPEPIPVQPSEPAVIQEAAKTRMDLILDEVERSGKEMTVKLEAATPEVLRKAIQASKDRGFQASTDGKNVLIQPKQSPPVPPQEPVTKPEPIPAKPVEEKAKQVVPPEEKKAEAPQQKEILSEQSQSQRTVESDRPPLSQMGKAGTKAGLVTAEGKTRPVQYVAVEANEIIPSHDARKSFTRNEGGDDNERPYHDPKQGAASRNIVLDISKIDPNKLSMLLSDNPTPQDGPPITTDTGVVLGGNARSMGMQLAYHNGGEAAQRLRDAVIAASSKFGIDPKHIEGMKHPVIVRVLDHAGERGELSALLNESLAASKSQATIAVSQGKRVSEETAGKISAMLEPDGLEDVPTIREILGSPSKSERILHALRADGAWSDLEIDLYTDPATGTLNDDGKAAIEKLLIGKLISDPSIVGDASPGVRQKLIAALGPLVRGMSDKEYGPRLTQVVKDAVAAFAGYKAETLPLERYFMVQKGMFEIPGQGDYAVAGMVHALDTMGPVKFKKAMDGVVRSLGIKSGTKTKSLFGEIEETVHTVEDAIQQEINPPLKPPKPSLQQSADKALTEAIGELKSFVNKVGKTLNTGFNPELAAAAGKVVAKFYKAGVLQFKLMLKKLAEAIGLAEADKFESVLESEWDKAVASGEFPGMEPRVPPTPVQQEQAVEKQQTIDPENLTSIKKEVVNKLRDERGLPPREEPVPETVEQWADEARMTIANDPMAAIRLVNQLTSNPQPITERQAMLLQFHYRNLVNNYTAASDEYFAAVAAGDTARIVDAKTNLVIAGTPTTQFEETVQKAGTSWGRTGVAFQQMLRKDFSLEAILRKGREANAGQPLNEKQTAELTAMAKEMEGLKKQLEAERKRREELEAELAAQRQHEEVVKEVKSDNVRKKTVRRQKAEKRVEDAWAAFNKAVSTQASAGLPVNLLPHVAELATAYVDLGVVRVGEFLAAAKARLGDKFDEEQFRAAWEKVAPEAPSLAELDNIELSREARRIQRTLVQEGMTDRDQVTQEVHKILKEELPDLTMRQTMDALSRYGIFQTPSKNEVDKILRNMRSELLKLSQIDQQEIALKRVDELRAQGKSDEEIGNALQKENLLVAATGLVRDNPTETVRQLTKIYNENKKSIPASTQGREGLLQTSLGSIERGLLNRIRDLNWELSHGERIVSETRERPTSDRIKELEAERDTLLKAHREMFPPQKKAMTNEQKLALALKSTEKAIERLAQQIETRNFDKEPRNKLTSDELKAARARLDSLKAQKKMLQALELSRWEGEGGGTGNLKPRSAEEIARLSYETRVRNQIAEYEKILAEGDFSPKPKKPVRTLSDAELKLKREYDDVRSKVLQKFADYELAHMSTPARILDTIREISHFQRALATSVDFSPFGRQGGPVAFSHPVLAANVLKEVVTELYRNHNKADIGKDFSWGEMGKFLSGLDTRQAEFNVLHDLNENEQGRFRLQAGLAITSSEEQATKQEEMLSGRFAKHIPVIAGSGRIGAMILNKMRAVLFDTMAENIGRGGRVSLDEGKMIAQFVNMATGRTDWGNKGNQILSNLNIGFFSARWVASRFEYLANPFILPFRGGGLKENWRVKREIYKEYGRTFGSVSTVLGIVALAGALLWDDDDEDKPRVELDPRSPDFLKIRMGETRLDLMFGLSQVLVLSSQFATHTKKSSITGKVKDIGEGAHPQTRADLLIHFGRSKLAPIPGAVWTMASGWKNVVNQPETPVSLGTSLLLPISLADASKSITDRGIPQGAALDVLSAAGAGLNTYGPKTSYAYGTQEQREKQIQDDLKYMAWDSPERPAYSEYLTDDQLEQFAKRREEKRGAVIYNATYDGKNEDEIKTRDKNREILNQMKSEGITLGEARSLLKEYYLRTDSSGKRGSLREKDGDLKESYQKKLRALNRLFAS